MNHYDIIDEFGYTYPKVLDKVINRTLALENVNNAIFSIIFIDDDKIHEINKKYRDIDRKTDVISFAYEDNQKNITSGIRVLGEIFISIPTMKEQAKEYNHSETREICFLVVHGLLHLLGYDHQEKDEEEIMFSKQEGVLNEFKETRREKN